MVTYSQGFGCFEEFISQQVFVNTCHILGPEPSTRTDTRIGKRSMVIVFMGLPAK